MTVNRALKGGWKMKGRFIFSLAIFLGLSLGILMGRGVEWIQVASSHESSGSSQNGRSMCAELGGTWGNGQCQFSSSSSHSFLDLDLELYQLNERIKKLEELVSSLKELFSPSLNPSFDCDEEEIEECEFEPAVFLKISVGNFLMGSPGSESGRGSDEGPQHSVTLTRDFEIQRTEVTQWHWFSVMGSNPSYFVSRSHCPEEHVILQGTALCPNHPVEQVSWNDIQTFLSFLNLSFLNEREEAYHYRLPTEAEWEYATRAGTQTAYSFGNDVGELSQYGWYNLNSGGQTRAVAGLLPNPWGLYDVHGNVWEWVQDRYSSSYPSSSSRTDPLHTSGDPDPVLRGGHWGNDAHFRSADRHRSYSSNRYAGHGFRLVRVKK